MGTCTEGVYKHMLYNHSLLPAPCEVVTAPFLQEQEPKMALVVSHLGVLAEHQPLPRGIWAKEAIAAS